MISIIAVIGQNRALGKDNKLLWDLPEDMARFKKLTSGQTVIMGRKTFESIGRPLPDRRNIVITRDQNYRAKNCAIAHSLKDALKLAKQISPSSPKKGRAGVVPPPLEGGGQGGVFIIGGGQVYAQALPYADKLYLTVVEDEPEADTFFPDYSDFKNIVREEKKEYNGIKYKFVELTK